jgi:hypothetical protein
MWLTVITIGGLIDHMMKPKPYSSATPLPLSPPPPKLDKSLGGGVVEDRHVADSKCVGQVDDKVAGLHAYHRACSLCQFCVEKHAQGHKCAPTL